MKIKHLFYLFFTSLIVFQFSGCVAAAAAYQAVALGSLAKGTIDSIEKANIDAAVSPGVTKEQLYKIKRLAFIFSENNQQGQMNFSDGLMDDIMFDNITLEMLKMGYELVGVQKLKKALQDQGDQDIGTIDIGNAIKAGKIIGLQAIITGSINTSSSFGSSGLFSTKVTSSSKIQSVTIKIIGVETGDTLMVVAINYKHGKKPDEAAKSIARIIKTKLEDPFGDTIKNKKKKK